MRLRQCLVGTLFLALSTGAHYGMELSKPIFCLGQDGLLY